MIAIIETTSSDDTMSSSIKSENLREIWKILDENSPLDDNDDDDDGGDQQKPTRDAGLVVTGVRPPSLTIHSSRNTHDSKKTNVLKSPKSPTPRSVVTTGVNKKTTTRIRNYNFKD